MSSMVPPASSTAAFRFSHTCRVCASISPMPAIVPSGRRAVMPEMKTMRPRASTMVAWEKCPLGWRILDEVICFFGVSCLRLVGFDLDEHVAILPGADVDELVGNAGLAPDRLPRLLVGLAGAAVVEVHHVL